MYNYQNNNSMKRSSIFLKVIMALAIVFSASSVAMAQLGSFGETINRNGEECIRVYTAEQFINALGSNRHILVAKNTEINLTPVLNSESMFRTRFKMWMPSVSEGIEDDRPTVVSEEVFDGRQLSVVNMKDLIIEGEYHSRIVVEPRYAYCINFVNCVGCKVINLTMGHTEGGYCDGGVIGILRGYNNVVSTCDLYGCGTYGLQLLETKSFALYNSNIHDCKYGILFMRDCYDTRFVHCDFFDNKEFTLVEAYDCEEAVFEDCRFYRNWEDSKLFYFTKDFTLLSCEVYHPTNRLGTMSLCKQNGNRPNNFKSNASYTYVEKRDVGPDNVQADGRGDD